MSPPFVNMVTQCPVLFAEGFSMRAPPASDEMQEGHKTDYQVI
ncbi:protein of unknown function [Candidatus Filomicrobium marinum]|uniref:Uncharacterized protein n=1 Tax=Candidatus Filomicrobium marinum TaxID=1608628 RepID=A0A0D6JB65_9HYPH|nr:protein of unknown function [Candidatus Filomicrobium marinum]